MLKALATALLGTVIACSMAVAAPGLRDGSYSCAIGFGDPLGRIEIANGAYSGPARSGAERATGDFTVDETGAIIWHGTFGTLPQLGMRIIGSRVIDLSGGFAGFHVFAVDGVGSHRDVSCVAD